MGQYSSARQFTTKSRQSTKTRTKVKEPEQSRVVLLNDDYTHMNFVVEILMLIFHKNLEEANMLMMDVHRKGKGIAGVYPNDIALTKSEEVHTAAREKDFPLRCVVEPV